MIQIRPSDDRGHAQHGWLDSRFTFSFADYDDPKHVQFRSLRVINEDHIAPGQGFGMHPHRDMEIITYILEGAIEHRDNMGNRGVIRPGEIQKMSAGTGILHSEFNPSQTQPAHLLQIWMVPSKRGIKPTYEEHKFAPRARWTVSARRWTQCHCLNSTGCGIARRKIDAWTKGNSRIAPGASRMAADCARRRTSEWARRKSWRWRGRFR